MAHAQTVQTIDVRGWPMAPGAPLLPAIGPRLTFSREEEIFGEGEPSEHIYQVLEGVVRTCRFSSDGRRQIEDFHLAGEYFGLEIGADHTCSAEAVGAATVQLPMSRQEIGDYLGLTIETVSRTFTHLEAERLIGLTDRRRVSLRDRGRLLDYCA